MSRQHESLAGSPTAQDDAGQVGVADSVIAEAGRALGKRWIVLLLAVGLGILAGLSVSISGTGVPILPLLCLTAFLGGLLSTWSPCGYSSLSLLRPAEPYSAASVAQWLPTLAAHAIGYLLGGAVLAGVLVVVAWLLPSGGLSGWVLIALSGLALAYGVHQLGFVRMPYPQRRAQVSHGARMHLPMWKTGLVYGWELGLNFVTYVRTPILYLIVAAAVLSGSVVAIALLLLSLNLGRFLPLLVNMLPLPDWEVQRWMATHDQDAVRLDAFVLLFGGTVLAVWGLS